MNDATKDLILGVFEASLEAQLRAVRPPPSRRADHRESATQA